MLKGIHPVISPPLLHALACMGHGDELALLDRNYPAYAADRPVVHLGATSIPEAAGAILQLFPLDDFVDAPVLHMSDPSTPGQLTPCTWVRSLRSHSTGPAGVGLRPLVATS